MGTYTDTVLLSTLPIPRLFSFSCIACKRKETQYNNESFDNPFSPTSLSVCKFSLYYPHKISCLVMRVKQMIIYSNLSKMKYRIPPTCLQGNYRDSLGEFSNLSYGVFGAVRVKNNRNYTSCSIVCVLLCPKQVPQNKGNEF